MSLYTFEVTRLIDRPARDRKGASRLLNQQIDYYHLSYLPFVDEFVTNDVVLAETASSLILMFGLHVAVHTAAVYRSNWIRQRLLA